MIENRGTLDLTYRIEQLEKQKKILQDACRKAGRTIKEQQQILDAIQKGAEYEHKIGID